MSSAERYPILKDFYRNQPVFLTGSTGFVGSHLARELLKLGADLRLLVRTTSRADLVEEFRSAGAQIFQGDLGDRDSLSRAAAGAKYIFHIGALYREAKFPDEVYFRVNLDGTKYLLEQAEKNQVQRFVYCSTTGVHSHIENPPADETAPFHPADVYQRSKCQAEELVQQLSNEGKVRATIIRPAMIWGDGDTRFLKLFRGIAKRTMPLIGNGSTWTHWIYIEDLVDAFLLAPTTEASLGQAYIIAGRAPVPMKQVFETLARISGTRPLPFNLPIAPIQMLGSIVEGICRPFGIEPPIHRRRADFFIKNRAFKTEKAKRDLGFSPRYSFEEEATRIYDWYKSQGWLNSTT